MKQFKTQSKRILDLMINSIYTHKEIFLRELISNCSDALDKLCFKSLTDGSGLDRNSLEIKVVPNETARTLTISDNGIGMTADELDKNLGTIAQSGSLDFKKENADKNDLDIIGQFGVGFYSAFMVAQKVVVISKAYGSDEANMWISDGVNGYEIKPAEKNSNGTEIVLFLKDNVEGEDYDKYLKEYELSSLIKKYSDYIRFPIKMLKTKYKQDEADPEKETTYLEEETVNSMIPLWKKNKSEITEENYNSFYKDTFFDYSEPVTKIHTSVEGAVDYKALLFVPSKAPYDYYSKTYEKGLKLYTNGVLITDKCAELLPDYFSFVKGVVDSELTLNISRETIQNNRQLSLIAKNLEKKIKAELENLLKTDREKYEKFFKEFGMQLKYGVYADWGMNKDILQDLLLFHSVKQDKLVTLKEYVDAMLQDQKYIYYASGSSVSRIKSLPQAEKVLDAGFDILCCIESVDEFALKSVGKIDEKEFKSVSDADNGIEDKEEAVSEDYKDITDFIKEALGDKVVAVVASKRLKSHFVCLTSKGELSIEMEKVINALPNADKIKADKVLEINVDHPAFAKVKASFDSDKEKLKLLSSVMYASAELIAGLTPDDPTALSDAIFSLID